MLKNAARGPDVVFVNKNALGWLMSGCTVQLLHISTSRSILGSLGRNKWRFNGHATDATESLAISLSQPLYLIVSVNPSRLVSSHLRLSTGSIKMKKVLGEHNLFD